MLGGGFFIVWLRTSGLLRALAFSSYFASLSEHFLISTIFSSDFVCPEGIDLIEGISTVFDSAPLTESHLKHFADSLKISSKYFRFVP